MNRPFVNRLARAVLYEGYILYPYRPSVKNRQRWTFGGLYPRSWSDAHDGTDPWRMQTECLISGSANAKLNVTVRFLHLIDRTVGKLPQPLDALPADLPSNYQLVETLDVGGQQYQPWQEAAECEEHLGEFVLADLLNNAEQSCNDEGEVVRQALIAGRASPAIPPDGAQHRQYEERLNPGEQLASAGDATTGAVDPTHPAGDPLFRPRMLSFHFPEHRTLEPLRGSDGKVAGLLIRQQRAVSGEAELACTEVAEGLFRITVKILNRTPFMPCDACRDEALLRSMVSTHTLLTVEDGEFVSLTDPPEKWRAQASACRNIGGWPVLVGEKNERDTILSSPIILPDYPQLAPESLGDLFDSTEIDEILTLRIMTLTDEEKRTAAATDTRVRDLLARTESLAREQLMNLHGTIRGFAPVAPAPGNNGMESWNPLAEEPDHNRRLGEIAAHGVVMKPGDSVRFWPLGRSDIFDIALEGKLATIVSIEQDFEDRIHLAVTVDDDPGKDLGAQGKPGHRFFFGDRRSRADRDLQRGVMPSGMGILPMIAVLRDIRSVL